MSKKSFNINYKESQMLKHALQEYIKRDTYSKYVEEEQMLLDRVKQFVEEYKKYIGISK